MPRQREGSPAALGFNVLFTNRRRAGGLLVLGMVLPLLQVGCHQVRVAIDASGPPPGKAPVAILTVQDDRPADSHSDHNSSALGLIPGFLYSEKRSTLGHSGFVESLQLVLHDTVIEARLFDDVALFQPEPAEEASPDGRHHPEPPGAAPRRFLCLRPIIHQASFEDRIYSYYLGPFFGLTWLLGLPIEKCRWEMSLTLVLEDGVTGDSLWHHKLEGSIESSSGLYYRGHTLETASREILAAALTPLRSYLEGLPAEFWEAPAPSPRPVESPLFPPVAGSD